MENNLFYWRIVLNQLQGIQDLRTSSSNPPLHLYSPFQDGESIPSYVVSSQASDSLDYSIVSAYTWCIAWT